MARPIPILSLALALACSAFGAGCALPTPDAGPAITSTASVSSVGSAESPPAGLELFTSESCPHCQIVKREISDNGWDKSLPISQKPLEQDANRQLVAKRAKACKLALDRLQVPLLWDGRRCLTGDGPILDYLKRISKHYETPTSTSP